MIHIITYSRNETILKIGHHAKGIALCMMADSLTTRLFKEILEDPNHNLHGLLPPMNETIRSLRQKRTFSIPRCKTKRYQSSFIIANALHRKL